MDQDSTDTIHKEIGDEYQSIDKQQESCSEFDTPVLLESVAVPNPEDMAYEPESTENEECSNQLHTNSNLGDHLDTRQSHSIKESVIGASEQSSTTANISEDSLIHHSNHLSSQEHHKSDHDLGKQDLKTRSEIPKMNTGDGTEHTFGSGDSSVLSPVQANCKPLPLNTESSPLGATESSSLNTLSLEEEMKQKENGLGKACDIPVTDSPAQGDRDLEQLSEVLLDSDQTQSDEEVQDSSQTADTKTKPKKKVRFADEVQERESGLSRSSTHSPPLRLPVASSPEDVARQGRMPVSPSSPKQPENSMVPQFSVDDLIAGIHFPAQYLGSTPIFLSGVASAKSSRMYQAQQAVKLIKDPETEGRPQCAVNIKISTQAITVSDNATNVDMMEHPLHTISYVADIDNVLVVMAHVIPMADPTPSSPVTTPVENREEVVESYTPKMTCHVLDTENARNVAMVIGQAFSAAYKQFLRSNGISEEALEQAEYTHILNAQTVPQVEVESFNDRNKTRKLTLAKHKGELMGVMVMESGYGSAIPSCVIAHLSRTGAAMKSGLLNVGDHIISINRVNLVGMPKKTCIEQLKKCRYQDVVKMTVCSCPAVVEVTIVRPDLKYQLGFSVQKGMITSLIRGSIAERSGIRVGHRIIEINGTSTVSMDHNDVVHLLSCTVGDLHLRTMPDLMYKLLTGQITPDYH